MFTRRLLWSHMSPLTNGGVAGSSVTHLSRRLILGKLGETMARDYLEGLGYRMIQRNFRTKEGEIDIIADHHRVLSFVEVRTRISDMYGHPLETIGPKKQAKLRSVAVHYLKNINGWFGGIRFDVLGILMNEGSNAQFTLVQNAFFFTYHR